MPYSHLTISDRFYIEILFNFNFKQAEIAKYISKSQSTISRELRKNIVDGIYSAKKAYQNYKSKRKKSKRDFKLNNPELLIYCIKKLQEYWSPEQIAGRLKLDFLTNKDMQVTHETIYKYIIKDQKSGGELYKYLRLWNNRYKRRFPKWIKRKSIKGRTFIDKRPDIVNKKERIGDWEGDTIVSKGKKSFIATFTERKTCYLVARKLENLKSNLFNYETIQGLQDFPKEYLKTITFDNGVEMSKTKIISSFLGLNIYYAFPFHPWERGLNEYTNRLLRQFYPKKYDFSNITQTEIDKVVKMINNRPRKKLNYLSPYEVMFNKKYALRL